MNYTIKAHPTMYAGVMFRSRLEARWAAFFDLNHWSWQYEPVDLDGWTPDFRVRLNCGHSECAGCHELLVEVKPYRFADQFDTHALNRFDVPYERNAIGLGQDPSVSTKWEMAHGAGGGLFDLLEWAGSRAKGLWKEAGNLTQYRPEETK